MTAQITATAGDPPASATPPEGRGGLLRYLSDGKVAFWCTGCGCAHAVTIGGDKPHPRWELSGPPEAPTLTPSVLVQTSDPDTVPSQPKTLCHLFLRAGQLEYLSDSAHSLAGCAVPLESWPM